MPRGLSERSGDPATGAAGRFTFEALHAPWGSRRDKEAVKGNFVGTASIFL